ncbi:MAG: T6SS immunity protein Tli4 family protein [Halopseudomonas sabulinigri]
MRLVPFTLALLPALAIAESAPPSKYQTPEGWRTECLGRSQFDMPATAVWQLQIPYGDTVDYAATDPWANRSLDYGTDPGNGIYKFVRIRVSAETTREAYEHASRVELPNETKAKIRVMKARIEARKARFDAEGGDKEQYIQDLLALDEENKKYRKMIAEITIVQSVIDFFEEEGRPTEELEEELAGYEKQIAALPTDERYEKERAFELGIPDAAGAWHPDRMVALLWRNNRIFHFEFGPKNGEYDSSSEAIEPAARDLLARFRPRQAFEIPQEPGVCVPFGFIADDGTENYYAGFSWHVKSTPYVLNSLTLSNSATDAIELLPMLTKRLMGNPFPAALVATNIGPRRIDIGNSRGTLTGRSLQAIDPDGDRLSSHAQYNLNAGAVAGKYTPTLLYKLQTYANDQPPPPIEQAEADVLNFMKSFRPLPGMQALYEAAENQQ